MKHFEQQSYYELLEVPVTASEDQILDAYARAMETYSPDSIAVYSLVDPDQLESLRQRLGQALEVLSELERRLEYDRKIGVTRSVEELERLRAESLKRAAGAPDEQKPSEKPSDGEGEPPAAAAAPVEPPGIKPSGFSGAAAEPVEEEPVIEVEVLAEENPATGKGPAVEQPAPEVLAAPPSDVTPPVVEKAQQAPAPANEVATTKPEAPSEPLALVPVQPAAGRPGVGAAQGPATTPAPGSRPAIHSRPARPGAVVPPPLPPRGALRPPIASRAEPPGVQRPAPEPPPSRDSRTRLKTVVDIPSDAEFNGELLRRVREGLNISLQMLADRTRISARHVESIEADRYDSLPASVYLRGMLMSIARELGLDPLRVSRSYMTLVASGEKSRR
ncbi:helix-turn-helix domain-containing protein [Archangium violaceum]|uniref:helix-turn-helix domain-containing protein n=1 Tax=Archangium violaceum TaxID=83451 RepID=UPI001951BF68|nr:helix-turn-helix domain-containing protein [Archangium violaceum]QRN93274.1 helix-turn-helix domain-containing protein [Archangium violaceum]